MSASRRKPAQRASVEPLLAHIIGPQPGWQRRLRDRPLALEVPHGRLNESAQQPKSAGSAASGAGPPCADRTEGGHWLPIEQRVRQVSRNGSRRRAKDRIAPFSAQQDLHAMRFEQFVLDANAFLADNGRSRLAV